MTAEQMTAALKARWAKIDKWQADIKALDAQLPADLVAALDAVENAIYDCGESTGEETREEKEALNEAVLKSKSALVELLTTKYGVKP